MSCNGTIAVRGEISSSMRGFDRSQSKVLAACPSPSRLADCYGQGRFVNELFAVAHFGSAVHSHWNADQLFQNQLAHHGGMVGLQQAVLHKLAKASGIRIACVPLRNAILKGALFDNYSFFQ